ncbi:helix-turn-helix domain-containing protein [Romboutsia maritimum]|uniref:Helix-turn-helix domain-containing protein n=1 Tax=Romboutsia maritimum TaxID=2020948 RepID=A0A371IS43_9FIRM|nr:AraC family transcriptional regulator [Romboutsia maritimum]RDY23308.1 helix-turn-helix domain-containing protein [Romboutsia maritimum]
MNGKQDIVDMYYKYIEQELSCRTSEELLGKKYVISKKFGVGNFYRMKIEDGLEISTLKISKTDMYFQNRKHNDDILEIGYCYSGCVKIFSSPQNKEYTLKEGDVFLYKALNDVEYFKFIYNNCQTISIHINLKNIKNVINPIWENRIITDWNKYTNNIFKEDILIIEKASLKIKELAKEIDSISVDNIMGYMKLKLKTIEFLDIFFQEKFKEKKATNLKQYKTETEIVIKAKEIIEANFQNIPSVKELASYLNISIYKLQEEFKNITGDTVYEYIKKVRIEKSKYLLKSTEMSILEIANEIGYENPSKFSSLFKRYNNITPLKYRKLNIEN